MHNRSELIFLLLLVVAVTACNRTGDSQLDTSSQKFKRYYLQGQQLYSKHCSNCHQENGAGLGRVYPPLNKSDFMDQNTREVVCLMRYGRQGELTVNGINFNQKMPGNPVLTDLEIAEIATYIYNSWENKKGLIDVNAVTLIIDSCRNVNP